MKVEEIFEDDTMESDETKKNVDKLKNEVNKLNSEIEEIQGDCKHTDYTLKNTSQETAVIRKVCDSCNATVGIPSSTELKENGWM